MIKYAIIFLALLLPSAVTAKQSDEDAAKQIIHAYYAAFERKDFQLFEAVTWEDGTPDVTSCANGGHLCRTFAELNSNYLGGLGIVYRSKFDSWKTTKTRQGYEFTISGITRRYYNYDEFSGMWSKWEAKFLVTRRQGQWRLFQIESLSSERFGNDEDWQRSKRR